MTLKVTFHKTGSEIKAAIHKRLTALEARLTVRNAALDGFMQDEGKLRSYLIRSTQFARGHGGGVAYELYSKDDISSEEKEEIDQLCRRIFEIEQEIRRLRLIASHLADERTFELEYNDLLSYGFDQE